MIDLDGEVFMLNLAKRIRGADKESHVLVYIKKQCAIDVKGANDWEFESDWVRLKNDNGETIAMIKTDEILGIVQVN